MPMMVPPMRPTPTATSATSTEMRAAKMARDSSSRPTSSVPSQCVGARPLQHDGDVEIVGRIGRHGIGEDGANDDDRDEQPADRQQAPALPVDAAAGRAGSTASAVISPPSARTWRGSSRLAQDVDEHVRGQHDDGHHQRRRQQHGIVAVDDADQHQRADARQQEDVLDDDDAAEQEAELDRADGEIGDQRIAHGVAPDDDAARRALGERGADIVRGQHLDHRGAHDPQQQRGGHDAQATPPA